MYINYKEIKDSARHSLNGNWKVAILSTLVYSIVNIIGDLIPKSSTIWSYILEIIFDAIFTFGYTAIILNIVRGEKANFLEIFDGCRRFLKGLGMTLVVGIYTLLWSLLLIVPGIIATIKYSMTYYIWVDNPNIDIEEAISQSIEMTHGHKLEIFKLVLSFIGWIALVLVPAVVVRFWYPEYFAVIMSLGMIFITPYIEVSFGTVYTKLLQERQGNWAD